MRSVTALWVGLLGLALCGPTFPQDADPPAEEGQEEKGEPEPNEEPKPADPAKDPQVPPPRKVDKTSPTALALDELLSVDPNYSLEDESVELTYDFMDDGQLQDWQSSGFDRFCTDGGMWLGAGSQGQGLAAHRLELKGDFDIEFTVAADRVTPSSDIVFVVGKAGARYGNQFVSKGSRGYAPVVKKSQPKLDMFAGGRTVTLRYQRKGDTLTVWANKAKLGETTKLASKLDGRVGVWLQNASLRVTRLTIKAKVDASKL